MQNLPLAEWWCDGNDSCDFYSNFPFEINEEHELSVLRKYKMTRSQFLSHLRGPLVLPIQKHSSYFLSCFDSKQVMSAMLGFDF